MFLVAFQVTYRVLGDVTRAEDAASEAMARALVSWRRVGPMKHRNGCPWPQLCGAGDPCPPGSTRWSPRSGRSARRRQRSPSPNGTGVARAGRGGGAVPGGGQAGRRHRGPGGPGITIETGTARTRQDLATDDAAEFRHVRCPALVLHGGADLNVPVADAITAFQVLRAAGNDDVRLTVLPGLDHYFNPVPADPSQRVWNRVSLEGLRRPMAREALDVIAAWAVRVLRP